MIWCHVDPVARTLDRTKNLAGGDINTEDSSAQSVQRARFDVFPMRDHPEFVVGRDKDILRRAEMGPHAEELPFGSEYLDAIILAVAYIDCALGVELHGVGRVELAGSASGLTPFEQILAVLGKLDYARVAIAIGHIEGAISREGDVGGLIEGVTGCSGLSFLPQREQQFPFLSELHHLVAADVGGPDVSRGVDPQSVGRSKHSFSPRAKIAALGVENNHRISAVATVKDEHFSPCVDGHGGDASELPARWHRIVISVKTEIGLL